MEGEGPDLAPHGDVSFTTTPGPRPLPDDDSCASGHKTYSDVLVTLITQSRRGSKEVGIL